MTIRRPSISRLQISKVPVPSGGTLLYWAVNSPRTFPRLGPFGRGGLRSVRRLCQLLPNNFVKSGFGLVAVYIYAVDEEARRSAHTSP